MKLMLANNHKDTGYLTIVFFLFFNLFFIIDDSEAYYIELGQLVFRPGLHHIQQYLKRNGIEVPKNNNYLYRLEVGDYEFGPERKENRWAIFIEYWDIKSSDSTFNVNVDWFNFGVAGSYYLPAAYNRRINPFIDFGFGLSLSGFSINERDLAAIGWSFDFSGGLEIDIIKERLFTRLTGGYKLHMPFTRFRKEELVDIKNYAVTTYYYAVTDEIDVKEYFCSYIYGIYIGLMF